MSDKQTVQVPETITVGELADKFGVGPSDVIAELMKNGVMATINELIDYDTAAIIGEDMGYEIEPDESEPEESQTELDDINEGDPRPPVIAVMGHVDHGKTTLLDAIRKSDVAADESGGITQHISAYQIRHNDRDITFLDTPGHQAFASLREHGARLTDVALLVVAADDGVKPQTKEAIKFARSAGVKIVVAINKIDVPGANVNKVQQELSEEGLMPESWGGDVVMVEVSAKEKTNIDKLLEVLMLVSDIEELKAPKDGTVKGVVIESHMSKGRGPVATVLIKQGTIEPGKFIVAGSTYARVRSLRDYNRKKIESAGPSSPVIISGFKDIPSFGTVFESVKTEKQARKKSKEAKHEDSSRSMAKVKKITTHEDIFSVSEEGNKKLLNVVVKGDVKGSVESVVNSLESLGNDEVGVKIVQSGVGDIQESDISVAKTSNAVILGFNVAISGPIRQLAIRESVETKFYTVIYELIDEIRDILSDLLEPEVVEEEVGELEIKGVFKITRDNLVCGGLVKKGRVSTDVLARIKSGDELLGEAKLEGLEKEKQATKEVVEGEMCGLNLSTDGKVKAEVGDKIEFFTREEKQRTL